MSPNRFDRISRLFAERRTSRRKAIAAGGAVIAATGLATAQRAATSQDATPEAETDKTSFLFVQSFGAGAIAATEHGTLTLTADHLTGQTIFFSDRPERIVGLAPTRTSSTGSASPRRTRPTPPSSPRPRPGRTSSSSSCSPRSTRWTPAPLPTTPGCWRTTGNAGWPTWPGRDRQQASGRLRGGQPVHQ